MKNSLLLALAVFAVILTSTPCAQNSSKKAMDEVETQYDETMKELDQVLGSDLME